MDWIDSNLTGKIIDPRAAQTAEGVTQPEMEIEWMNYTNADSYFAIIPEWVLYANISSNAIRLYCVLRRRADKESGRCYPSRKTLAKEMGNISTRTLDRAIEELIEIGALKVLHRMNGEEYTSNLYTVISARPIRTDALGSDTDALGSATNGEQTIVIKPETSNHSHLKDIPNEFDEFWQAYPRKIQKKDAKKAFEKAILITDLQTILAGVERLKRTTSDLQFCPYPATWLNGERWADELETPKLMSKGDATRFEFLRRFGVPQTQISIEGANNAKK